MLQVLLAVFTVTSVISVAHATSVTAEVERLGHSIGACACSGDPLARDAGEKPLGAADVTDLHGDLFKVSVINDEMALNLFQKMTSQSDIPFGFPEDGCFARAHVMAYQLQKDGIETGKVFATGTFRIETEKAAHGKVTWGFHVAPFLLVDRGHGREIWVIDPSLFFEAVPLAEWLGKLTNHPKSKLKEVFLTNKFIYHPIDRDRRRKDFSLADLDSARNVVKRYRRAEEKRDHTKTHDL